MHSRQFTRLTNGSSKKLSHVKAAVALFMAWYNFHRIHSTLRVMPAVEANLTDHVWSVWELPTAESGARFTPWDSGEQTVGWCGESRRTVFYSVHNSKLRKDLTALSP